MEVKNQMDGLIATMAKSRPSSQALVPVANKVFKWDARVKIPSTSPIMGQIHRTIKNSGNVQYNLDLVQLAAFLEGLAPRMGKAVLEIIVEYHFSNPSEIQVMTKKDTPPFNGFYDASSKSTGFDLVNFSDSLNIILWEFQNLVMTHSQVRE